MKRKWLVTALLAAAAAGCVGPKMDRDRLDVSGMDLSASRQVVLTVYGLSCPLCSNNLDGQLRRIKGVQEATIDLKTGEVVVRLADGHAVTPEDLAGAVKDAGFTLKRIESGAAAE